MDVAEEVQAEDRAKVVVDTILTTDVDEDAVVEGEGEVDMVKMILIPLPLPGTLRLVIILTTNGTPFLLISNRG